MRLVLVRHGETEHNREQITLGRADVPLTERGRAQASALASSFADGAAPRPVAIYSSPLARARDTAGAIADALQLEVLVDNGLIEMDVGEMEHLTGTELRERYPDFLATWLSGEAATDARMPGGETLREVQRRAWDAIERMRARHPEEMVVAVTHNFVILMAICRALELQPSHFRRVRQALAARTVLDVRENFATLLQLNDNAHLVATGLADEIVGRG